MNHRVRSFCLRALCSVAVFLNALPLVAGGNSERAAPGVPTELSVLWWGGQSRHEKTLDVIELYESQHPHVRIVPEYLGWTGYWDRLAVLAAAGEMPDIYQMVVEQFPLFDRKSLAADLSAIPEFDASRIDDAALRTGYYNGRLIGAVLGTNAFALVYNPRIFGEAGVAPPTGSWTWDDFVNASIAIREATGLFGVDGYGTHNDFRHWIRANGYNSKFAADLSGPAWDDDALAAAFLERVVEFDDRVMPPFAYTLEYASNEDYSGYARGETAMSFIWSNLIGAIHDSLGEDSRLVPPPGSGSLDGLFLRPAAFFSIAESSSRKQEAARFVMFFLSDLEANRILSAERGVPVVPEIRDALAAETTTQNRIMFDYVRFVSENAAAPPESVPNNVTELRDALDAIVRDVAFGQLSPAEGASRLRAEWGALMSSNTAE